ncbi:amino acid transporter ANT1-like [Wolffia australiana]
MASGRAESTTGLSRLSPSLSAIFRFLTSPSLSDSPCSLLSQLPLVGCAIQFRKALEEGDASVRIRSYGDLGEKGFGWRGRFLTELLVVVSQAGGAVAYLVFIGENLASVVPGVVGVFSSSAVLFLVVLPLELGVAMVRSLAAIAPFSVLADACNALAIAIVVKDDLQLLGDLARVGGSRKAFNGASGLPVVAGVAVFCFDVAQKYANSH